MRFVHRSHQRFFLVVTTEFSDRTLREQFAIKVVTILETRWAHSRWRTDALDRLFGIRNYEWAKFAPVKASGMKCLQLLTFPHIEALSDVDKSGNRRIERPECPRKNCAKVGRSHGLRRRITGVPL